MTNDDDSPPPEAKIVALEDLREELQEKPLKETQLGELFVEVSTSPPQLWNRATAFIECEIVREATDRETVSDDRQGTASSEDVPPVEPVVTDVSKLARGWWAPEIVEDCDAMVTLDVHAGLPPENFVALATEEINEQIEAIRSDGDIDQGPPL